MENKKSLWKSISVALGISHPELAKKIKEYKFEEVPPVAPAAPVKLAEVKTKDGKTLSIEGEVGQGASVFTTNETGEKVPAPDGDYALEDGSTLKITGGMITEIVPGEPAAPAAPAAASVVPAPAQFGKVEVEQMILSALKERDDKIGSLAARLQKAEEQNKLFAELAKAIQEAEVHEDKPVRMQKAYAEMTNHEKTLYNRGLL